MNGELTVFPKDGWCPSANEDLGKYLSIKFQQEYVSPGVQGYAWNGSSYWTINCESSKEQYSIYSLLGIIREFINLINCKKRTLRNPAPEDPLLTSEYFQEDTSQFVKLKAEIYKLNRKKLLLRRSRR